MSDTIPNVKIICGDSLASLQKMDDKSVNCCVTSPPYWGLRDYGTEGQLGLEKTPEDYTANMVNIFMEVMRVLRDDGTLWLNLGDTYSAGSAWTDDDDKGLRDRFKGQTAEHKPGRGDKIKPHRSSILPPKNLVGIPWRVAFALQANGWYLRSDIIWSKPNPMPESVTDRPTRSHEYIFLMTKSPKYFYDHEAIKEPLQTKPHAPGNNKLDSSRNDHDQMDNIWGMDGLRNKRSVWTVSTQPFSEAHFAVFPPKLIQPCILSGCPSKTCSKCGAPWKRNIEPVFTDHSAKTKSKYEKRTNGKRLAELRQSARAKGQEYVNQQQPTDWKPSCNCKAEVIGGTVLDPFMGSGTTGVVSINEGRHFVGIELNPEYVKMAKARIKKETAQLNLFHKS